MAGLSTTTGRRSGHAASSACVGASGSASEYAGGCPGFEAGFESVPGPSRPGSIHPRSLSMSRSPVAPYRVLTLSIAGIVLAAGLRADPPRWIEMDYGPFLAAAVEIETGNIAHKGIAIRLDGDRGGVSRGREFLLFDTDTLRCAGAWRGDGFIDWRSVLFDGSHRTHVRAVGDVVFTNPPGPGWARPDSDDFTDTRAPGRDGKRYGPLPHGRARWKGLHDGRDGVVLSYTVGEVNVLESPSSVEHDGARAIIRGFELGPRIAELALRVIGGAGRAVRLRKVDDDRLADERVAVVSDRVDPASFPSAPLVFDGDASLEVARSPHFDMTGRDFSIAARLRTREGGTILSKSPAAGPWAINGKSFYVVEGRLAYDIGWVGVARSPEGVDDGKWHDVVMTWEAATGRVRFYVDGRGEEAPEEDEEEDEEETPEADVDADPDPAAVRRIPDLRYASSHPRQRLDILLPATRQTDEPLPVVVYVHGGAWLGGHRRAGISRLAPLVSSGRYAGVTVGYRLSGDAIWPAQLEDLRSAIRWLRLNAPEHGLDASRIGIWGPSTGGHLASLLAVTGGAPLPQGDAGTRKDVASRVSCVVSTSAPADLSTLHEGESDIEHDAPDSPVSLLLGGPPLERQEAAQSASPMSWVSPGDPPMLLVHGTADRVVPFAQSRAFHERLRQSDIDATLVPVEGGGHGDFGNPRVERRIAHFFARHLLARDVEVSSEAILAGRARVADGGREDEDEDEDEEDRRRLRPTAPAPDHVVRIGYTRPDFPEDGRSYFRGEISELRFYQRRLRASEIRERDPGDQGLVARWDLRTHRGGKVPDRTGKGADATLGGEVPQGPPVCAIGVVGGPLGARLEVHRSGELRLLLPPGATTRLSLAYVTPAEGGEGLDSALGLLRELPEPSDLRALTGGGRRRWERTVETRVRPLGRSDGPFVVEEIPTPRENPYRSWMRLGGLDFFSSGTRAAVCTWSGDVWLVDGIGQRLDKVRWTRIASGLHQPLGLRIVDDVIHVVGRDQITRLHDVDGDGETDFYECFNNDTISTEHFHEFAMDLQTDAAGNFYYTKGARHALDSVVPHHGTLLKVSKDGSRTEIVASGFRAPNGLCVLPDGSFLVSDQEGHWIPENRINRVEPGGFYGNMHSYHRGARPTGYDPPLHWVEHDIDRSPSQQLLVTSEGWGALRGRLLSLSFGTGKILLVLEETVEGKRQGGVVELPAATMPTGLMRARFHPLDGHLYACGLFAWGSDRTAAGGLFRIRYEGGALHLPTEFHATHGGIVLRFSEPLDRQRAARVGSFRVDRWNYKWLARYGSDDYRVSDGKKGRERMKVGETRVSRDGRAVFVEVDDMRPCMQLRVEYRLRAADGTRMSQRVFHTIHALGDERPWIEELFE